MELQQKRIIIMQILMEKVQYGFMSLLLAENPVLG